MFYKVRNENKTVAKKINNDLNLYDACNKIDGIEGGIVLNSYNELVAFYCSYDKKIKVGFKARDFESTKIINFNF